ncbi:MAG: hypothetical protein LBC62_06860 [Treponema sp.]|jgi:hypothetical protein|nr:hypothetical protein [Treponema sp.]
MKTKAVFLAALLFAFCALRAAWAQSSPATIPSASAAFDMTGFPQWAKDLRRGEIVAFGSFPFAFFFTNFAYDMYRSASHGWDRRYAPWPVKAAGSVGLTQREQLATLGVAAGGSVLIAVADHLILRYKRNKREKEIRSLPAGTPIIIRRPLDAEADEGPDGQAAEQGS